VKVFWSLDSYVQGRGATATIGTFDGVHLGHQKILNRLIASAAEVGGESVVLSFHPHPRQVLHPEDKTLRLLQSIEEKIAALEALGIDKLLLIPFTREFSEQDSQTFIKDILVKTIGIQRIVIGYDHHFGKDRKGGLKELQAGASEHSYDVEEIPAEQIDHANVSSTKIRQALQSGDVATANRFLGYDYGLQGTVVEGQKLGRTIGFPTANIQPLDPLKLIPAEGVYLARIKLGNAASQNGAGKHGGGWTETHYGMLNIGKKPTVGDHFPLGIEIHIFDFDRTIYGEQVRIEFLEWIRPDMKFSSMEELINALHGDHAASLELIKKRAHGLRPR
jgi:riboflavin kinase / FMN adenylyltransferase